MVKLTRSTVRRIIKEELSRILGEGEFGHSAATDAPQFTDPVTAWRVHNKKVMTKRVRMVWERDVLKSNPGARAKVFVTFNLDEGIKPPVDVEVEDAVGMTDDLVEKLKASLKREFEKEEHQNIWPGLTYGDATQPYTLS